MSEKLKIIDGIESLHSPLESETKPTRRPEPLSLLARLKEELKRTREEFEHRLELQAEETAALIREREMMLDKTKEFVYRHDDAGVFTYLSPSIQRITGYSLDEWSQHYTRFFTEHPDNDHGVRATELSLQTGEKSDPYRVEIFHKSGRRLTLEVDEEPVLEDGHVVGMVGLARDITEHVKDENFDKEPCFRLLLVGGRSESRGRLRASLEGIRCEVESTGRYELGAELCRIGLFDAVLMDCDTDLDAALRTARKMREQANGGATSVLLGLSEGSTTALRTEVRRSGMADLIDLEMNPADLGALLGEILGRE